MTTDPSDLTRPRYPMPDFVKQVLEQRGLLSAYEARPVYQQNDYLGWIGRAKRLETQDKRLRQMLDELEAGGVYMNMKHAASRKDVHIEYRRNFPLNAADVAAVFDDSGIRRPIHDLARIERMLANADLVLSAWHEGKLVGVCRALTDYSYCCYLSDLAVAKAHQKHGIGRELITRVRAAIGEEVALILLSAPEAMAYYPKVGFEKIENGFVIKRSR